MWFARVLRDFIRVGEVVVIDADGQTHRFGTPGAEPSVILRLHDRRLHQRLFFHLRLGFGEAYMDGTLTFEQGALYDCLEIYARSTGLGTLNEMDRWVSWAQLLWQRSVKANRIGQAQRNVAHHYDLSGELYRLFLDDDMQYSCGYFPRPDATLEEAQLAKKRHIAAKLLLNPGDRVLDIGSGWGGLGLYLAESTGASVTGVTLSREQYQVAERRAAKARLSGQARFHLRDYREEQGPYDRIVSVGMFEHVGWRHYHEFFTKLRDLLADDGVAVLHTIAYIGEPFPTNPWLDKYIFPGGYVPSLSEILKVTEQVGLWVTDVEVLRLHYAETLRHWRDRLMANRDEIAALYDERFCRMWEYYLAGCEVAFRHQGHMVAHLQLAKSIDAVPITRDYITDWDRTEPRREDAAA